MKISIFPTHTANIKKSPICQPQTYWCIAVILHYRVEIWKPKKEKKRQNLLILSLSVPHTRVELVIYCVRGSCPGPLDECGSYWTISLLKSGAKVQLFFELANFCIKKISLFTITLLQQDGYNQKYLYLHTMTTVQNR